MDGMEALIETYNKTKEVLSHQEKELNELVGPEIDRLRHDLQGLINLKDKLPEGILCREKCLKAIIEIKLPIDAAKELRIFAGKYGGHVAADFQAIANRIEAGEPQEAIREVKRMDLNTRKHIPDIAWDYLLDRA